MISRLAHLLLWRSLALACLALGLLGVLVPVLPTTPFLLVAAWAGGRGWPQLEAWLVAHPRWGQPIRRWRERRAVPRQAKWVASVTMATGIAALAWTSAPLALKLGVLLLMLGVATWLWRRPET